MAADSTGIWAIIPVKETPGAKQRLWSGVPAHLREPLVLTMLEDVLSAVSKASGLAGIALVTLDGKAGALGRRYGTRILTDDARGGHTAAVAGAARTLASEGATGMMQLPGDIPLVTADEISHVLSMHRPGPSFTIVPSHDDFGSNTIVVSPPTAVPLKFGDDSFFSHLETARKYGIEPQVIRLPGIGRDIDNAGDLQAFARAGSKTLAQSFLDNNGFVNWGRAASAAMQGT